MENRFDPFTGDEIQVLAESLGYFLEVGPDDTEYMSDLFQAAKHLLKEVEAV